MTRFNNTYRIESSRLQNWDYGSPGLYFVTICTRNREYYFGEIVNDSVETPCMASPPIQTPSMAFVRYSEIGQIAHDEWLKTPEIRPDMNLKLGEFRVMPNHFHAILMIGENKYNSDMDMDSLKRRNALRLYDATRCNQFGPQSKNLGSIIRGFKSSVTTHARKMHIDFGWQPRFHEHIIRNHAEFVRISDYITNNPENWEEDNFYGKEGKKGGK